MIFLISESNLEKDTIQDMLSKHKFAKGQYVSVRLRDWNASGQVNGRVVRGTIADLIFKPFGYNILLSDAVQFFSHIPMPIVPTSDETDRVEESDGYVWLKIIFVRETDLSDSCNLLMKLRDFMRKLVFREINSIYYKPPNEIMYINYFSPDGKIITLDDDKEVLKRGEKEIARLQYKVNHFYGFSNFPRNSDAQLTSEPVATRGKTLYFSMNRFCPIDFWSGIKWSPIEKERSYVPPDGATICGVPSQNATMNAPSFEQWFVCSKQLRLLIFLICDDKAEAILNKSKNEIISMLIIPDNNENYYLGIEVAFSKYLYAAIYLLAKCGNKTLPKEWRLPVRKVDFDKVANFEEWWSQKVIGN